MNQSIDIDNFTLSQVVLTNMHVNNTDKYKNSYILICT
ncbi:MAG: hypothetical protein ACI8RD_004208 [Bacillariaceae sp.]|jgi:hypothetical protein